MHVFDTKETDQQLLQHYDNQDNPDRCFVRLFKLYNSLCPTNLPPD